MRGRKDQDLYWEGHRDGMADMREKCDNWRTDDRIEITRLETALAKAIDERDRAVAENVRKDSKIRELESMLDFHVREPVDCNDPFLELGEWCASNLQGDDFNAVEPLINGLREHFCNPRDGEKESSDE